MEPVNTATIWDKFSDKLHHFLKGRTPSASDADDILQEVFIKVHQNLHQLSDSEKLESWLFRITRNALTDFYKKKKGVVANYDDLSPQQAPSETPVEFTTKSILDLAASLRDCVPYIDQFLNRQDFNVDIEQAKQQFPIMCPFLDQLSPKYAEAVFLTDWYGMSQVELAQHLGISFSGAKSRVQRGREKMKDLFMQCCAFEFDARGSIVDYQRRTDSCKAC